MKKHNKKYMNAIKRGAHDINKYKRAREGVAIQKPLESGTMGPIPFDLHLNVFHSRRIEEMN